MSNSQGVKPQIPSPSAQQAPVNTEPTRTVPATPSSGPSGKDAFDKQALVNKGKELLGGASNHPNAQRQEQPTPPRRGFYSSPASEPSKSRENKFFKDGSENENIHTVIYQSSAPANSIGWSQREFFAGLGDPRHEVNSLERNAEQEYLLRNIPKGALHEAAEIANTSGVGIAVRGTGPLAHMGIESGSPTKAQEFKNKTSKEMDLWLCDEMTFGDVGAVVHYDPRQGGTSKGASALPPPPSRENKAEWNQFVNDAWNAKRAHIEQERKPALKRLSEAGKISEPTTEKQWEQLKGLFENRLGEFHDEDSHYQEGGPYAKHVTLQGPFIHLKERPNDHMYGDHDLFAFTTQKFGQLTLDNTPELRDVQKSLQDANTFQAQHGGIWNWQPHEESHENIKAKIMGAHSPPAGEPLIYIQPGNVVTAAFYVPADKLTHTEEKLVSVWDCPQATAWLEATPSGTELLTERSRNSDS
ncbi:hypothetical protein POL68_09050 [Stigmatella sp. ncwal1]|uniref:Uncharacterized protein n=1 Tax=Stigmatella ashevillensis TaxID=2995309 RepID=A0ABT5D654_9BACT|nr:hypothetical protein [Stigmatella ashevillena]MDC0708613.1 hypothetical protein [Stigmatella ashevillena]